MYSAENLVIPHLQKTMQFFIEHVPICNRFPFHTKTEISHTFFHSFSVSLWKNGVHAALRAEKAFANGKYNVKYFWSFLKLSLSFPIMSVLDPNLRRLKYVFLDYVILEKRWENTMSSWKRKFSGYIWTLFSKAAQRYTFEEFLQNFAYVGHTNVHCTSYKVKVKN